MYLNTPCQAAQNIPRFFFVGLVLHWNFLPWLTQDFPSKLTMKKSQLLNIRVQPAGKPWHNNSMEDTATKDYASRLPQDTFVHSPLKATCTKLWQTTSMTIGNDPSSGHRKDLVNWGEPLQALVKSSPRGWPSLQIGCIVTLRGKLIRSVGSRLN